MTEDGEDLISEMSPAAVKRVEWLAHNMTYSPWEVSAMHIPGSVSRAHIEAVFQKVRSEKARQQ